MGAANYYLGVCIVMKKLLQWNSRIRVTEEVKPWLANPREITKEGFDRLVEKIRLHGFHSALVVDHNDILLSGNQRREALIKLGIKKVLVLHPKDISLNSFPRKSCLYFA